MTLEVFLKQQITNYQQSVLAIPLFQPKYQEFWTEDQKIKFVLTFYHIRGYLYRFLWHLGCQIQDTKKRQMILKNFLEEFDHDKIYFYFAEYFEVNCKQEILIQKYNLPFVQEFNSGHVEYILNNDQVSIWSLFGVYEALDNTDYINLRILAGNISSGKADLTFFDIHANANHFEFLSGSLQDLWLQDSIKVRHATEFILNHQLKMWQQLSLYILGEQG